MKSKLLFILLASFLSTSTVLAADLNTNTSTSGNTASGTTTQQQAQNQKDGEIVGWLVLVNQQEVDAAQLANQHQLSSAVKDYADKMEKDHSKGKDDVTALSQKINVEPVQTDLITKQKEAGEKAADKLKAANDQNFEVVYIGEMVKGHEAVLVQLGKFINKANNPDLKSYLQDTKKMVKQHLDTAKSIQHNLKK